MMGYHQIRLDKYAIPKTAIKTKYGSFELTVLQFGLTNAFGFFMSSMNEISSDFMNKFMIFYLDDILVYSKTWSEHLSHIGKVLERLRETKSYGEMKKCVFGGEELEYFGFKLCNNKLLGDPTKVKAKKA